MENDNTKVELARRAVNCYPKFRLLGGMLIEGGATNGPQRVIRRTPSDEVVLDDGFVGMVNVGHALPDLDDAATLGCLLALVREAWGDRPVSLVHDWLSGCWKASIGTAHHEGATEAEALVAALEAAP